MIEYLRFRVRLWRAELERNQAARALRKIVEQKKAQKASPEEIGEAEYIQMHEDNLFAEEVFRLHTRYLMREARRLIIPVPPPEDTEAWTEGLGSARRHLTQKGINDLRNVVRSEKKARAERVVMWVSGVVGIIGALIGLASILMRK